MQQLTNEDHGKAIATAIKLVGKPGTNDDPIRVEICDKGVTAYRKNRSAYIRFSRADYSTNYGAGICINGNVLRDILKLSRAVEIQDVNNNTVVFANNGCKWSLKNHYRSYERFTDGRDPIRQIAQIPMAHLRRAIAAGYKRAHKPAGAVIIVAGKYELPCREIESFLKSIGEIPDFKLQIWECENDTLRYGIMGLWITCPARKSFRYQPYESGQYYWLNLWGDCWSGFTNMLSAWESINPKYHCGIWNREEPVILKTFWGSEIPIDRKVTA